MSSIRSNALPADASALETALRRDRLVVLAALGAITLLAWSYLVWIAMAPPASSGGAMTGMDMGMTSPGEAAAPGFRPWAAGDFVFMFLMWAVMMAGMMTPSVAPMILLYARVGREAAVRDRPFAPAGWFLSGYLAAWTSFAAAATALQWGLEQAALLTLMMKAASPALGGALLVVAGVYQWLPLKHACLAHCRSPLAFIQRHGGFRPDRRGAMALGLRHGSYCIGCCWSLMALLFLGGVMNLLWIAGLSALVLVEKAAPAGWALARVAGAILIASGIVLLAGTAG